MELTSIAPPFGILDAHVAIRVESLVPRDRRPANLVILVLHLADTERVHEEGWREKLEKWRLQITVSTGSCKKEMKMSTKNFPITGSEQQ